MARLAVAVLLLALVAGAVAQTKSPYSQLYSIKKPYTVAKTSYKQLFFSLAQGLEAAWLEDENNLLALDTGDEVLFRFSYNELIRPAGYNAYGATPGSGTPTIGNKVGYGTGTCEYLFGVQWDCLWTIVLPGGTINVYGIYDLTATYNTKSIIGGTGKYNGAYGYIEEKITGLGIGNVFNISVYVNFYIYLYQLY